MPTLCILHHDWNVTVIGRISSSRILVDYAAVCAIVAKDEHHELVLDTIIGHREEWVPLVGQRDIGQLQSGP